MMVDRIKSPVRDKINCEFRSDSQSFSVISLFKERTSESIPVNLHKSDLLINNSILNGNEIFSHKDELELMRNKILEQDKYIAYLESLVEKGSRIIDHSKPI